MKNPLFRYYLVLPLATLLAQWATPAEGTELADLSHYLERVRQHDPAIAEARLRWKAVEARVPATGVLPDPELALGHFFAPIETRVGPQRQKLGLFQKIPWPERLKTERSLAEDEVTVAYYAYMDTLRRRIAEAKAAWIHLASIEQQRSILDRQRTLLEEALSTQDSRFTSGRGDLADRLLIRNRLTELESRQLALAGDQQAAEAEVRHFAGGTTGAISTSWDRLQAHPLPGRAALTEALLADNDLLKSLASQVERAKSSRDLAGLSRYPDVTLGFEYTRVSDNRFANPSDDGTDAFMGSIRISLPIWKSKYDALERSATHALSAKRKAQQSLRDDLIEAVHRRYAEAEARQRQIRLYEDRLLPQTREAYEATLSGFGSGQSDALHWIEAQRDLLDAEMGLVHLRTENLRLMNRLERLAAVELVGEQAAANNNQ